MLKAYLFESMSLTLFTHCAALLLQWQQAHASVEGKLRWKEFSHGDGDLCCSQYEELRSYLEHPSLRRQSQGT